MDFNEISGTVIDTAMSIHRELGPGLLEAVYESVLYHELQQRGYHVRRQVAIPIRYKNQEFDEGFRADIMVQDKVILELKSVEKMNVVHKKQLLTYLRLSGLKVGLLLNFGAALMRQGITRIVNDLEES